MRWSSGPMTDGDSRRISEEAMRNVGSNWNPLKSTIRLQPARCRTWRAYQSAADGVRGGRVRRLSRRNRSARILARAAQSELFGVRGRRFLSERRPRLGSVEGAPTKVSCNQAPAARARRRREARRSRAAERAASGGGDPRASRKEDTYGCTKAVPQQGLEDEPGGSIRGG